MSIGKAVQDIIKQFNLTPNSKQLDDFYHCVFKCHIEVAIKLAHYFKKGLKCLKLRWMQCIGPKESRKPQTANRFQKLADAYPNPDNKICPYKGAERLQAEASWYITEDF